MITNSKSTAPPVAGRINGQKELADHCGKLAVHHRQSANFWLGTASGTIMYPLANSFFYVGAHIEKLFGAEMAWASVIVCFAAWVLTLIGMGIRQGRCFVCGMGAGLLTVGVIAVLAASYVVFWMDEHWFIGLCCILILLTVWIYGLKFIVQKVAFKVPERTTDAKG